MIRLWTVALVLLFGLASARADGTLTVTYVTNGGATLTRSKTLTGAHEARLIAAYAPGGGPAADAFVSMVEGWLSQTIAFVKAQEAAAATAATAPIVLTPP